MYKRTLYFYFSFILQHLYLYSYVVCNPELVYVSVRAQSWRQKAMLVISNRENVIKEMIYVSIGKAWRGNGRVWDNPEISNSRKKTLWRELKSEFRAAVLTCGPEEEASWPQPDEGRSWPRELRPVLRAMCPARSPHKEQWTHIHVCVWLGTLWKSETTECSTKQFDPHLCPSHLFETAVGSGCWVTLGWIFWSFRRV